MYNWNADREIKGSVRSLPHGKLQDIRHMFDEQCEQQSPFRHQQGVTESHNITAADGDIPGMADDEPLANRWRQHISPPFNRSPVRVPRKHVSPSRPADGAYFPTPTPRKHAEHALGLSVLPINNLGQIASGVALSEPDTTPNRVSRVKDQFEPAYRKTSDCNIKIPLKPKNKCLSPSRIHGHSPAPNPEKRSPVLMRKPRDTYDSRDEHIYSRIWDKRSGNTSLGVPDSDTDRPVSVVQRSKMFENIGTNSATPPSHSKPQKPPPPFRQRSLSDDHGSDMNTNSQGKPLPPHPPIGQRSLVEKENDRRNSAGEDAPSVHSEAVKPAPPAKPRRTGAHDDYVKVKLENEAAEGRIKLQEVENENCDTVSVTQNKDTNVHNSERELPKIPVFPKKNKPTRPPPPNKKPRPFSIATDSLDFRSLNESDFDDMSKSKDDNPFYEMIPAEVFQKRGIKEGFKHWDLPRASHPEPIRRSLSAECLQKAVDDKGNIVYMDPEILCINSSTKGYDIYVDAAGYAVPHRLVRRNKSIDATNSSESSRPIGDRMKSKFRRFKNLFTDTDQPSMKKTTPEKGSQKRKIDAHLIRQKVNQAFEVLQSSLRQKHATNLEPEDESAEKLSNDSDSRVDEKEIRKRVEYSRSVRINTSKSIRATKKYQQKIYPQLFEHAMIVGLKQNMETSVYEPHVIFKFPEINDSNVSVPLFCFPDAANFKPSSGSSKSQSYNFVLTNFDGGRVYGYCRRLVPPKSPNKIPEVICIISPVDAFSMYNTLLEEIEMKRLVSLDAAQELLAASFGRPLPSPGQSETIRTLDESGEMETLFVTRDTDNRMENVNVDCLLTSLGTDKLLKVFATILMERSVLFCAKRLSVLSSTIHAIVSLLYPFSWQHTFIPVLPSDMIDVVCSPTPYIIGITASLLPKTVDLPIDENVLIVDIDKRSFVKCQGDEGTLLPKKIEKALKTSINMCRIDSEAKHSANLMISETFLRFFIEAVGHYGQFIITQPDGKKVFQKEQFIKGITGTSLQQLREWFVETQMFEVFKTKQLEKTDWGNTIELFQSRIQEHKFAMSQKRRLGKKSSVLPFSVDSD